MNAPARHSLTVFLLLVVPVILLWPCLFGERVFVPWDIAQFPPARTTMTDAEYADVIRNNNTDVTEIPVMFLPELEFIQDEIARGEIPHWNPYARSGTTVWASSILGLWYPINWLVLAFDDPADGLAIGALMSLAVAILLMYGFLTHLGLSPPAAVFGALAFGISGTLTVNLHFYQRINALIWLPGILWAIGAIRQAEGAKRIPALLGLALCFFMCHTAGFPPFALVVSFVSAAFALHQVLAHLRHGVRPALALAGVIGGGAVLGVLMASIQSLPMFEFFPESNRNIEPTANVIASGGYDPAGLLGYLCPTLYTHPHINVDGELRDIFSPVFWLLYSRASWDAVGEFPAGTAFHPNMNFCEYTVFVGTPTLLLAVAGLFTRGARLRLLFLLMIVALFSLAMAPPWMRAALTNPPFQWVPPMRYTGATCMFVAALAAIGLHALPTLKDGLRRGIWITAFVLGLACVGVAIYAQSQAPQELLDEMKPILQEKFAARFPEVDKAELPAQIQRFMGQYADGARRQLLVNMYSAGIALILSAAMFLVVPILRRYRHGIRSLQILVVVVTTAQLLGFGVPLNTGRKLQKRPLNNTPVHDFLRQERDKHLGSGGFSVLRAHDVKKRSAVPLPAQLPPDTLLNEHIRDQQIYTFVDKLSHLPLQKIYGPEQLARDTWPLSIRDDENLNLPYWDMIGVRFILTEDELKHAGTRVGPVISGPPNGEKTMFFYVYERPHPLPRAWVVHEVRQATPDPGREKPDEQQDVVDALVAKDFAPADYAIVDAATAAALGKTRAAEGPGNRRPVSFPIPHETNSLTIDVGPGDPGFLVVNDTKMKGWTVTVNGRPAEIHRANLFQRLVELPTRAAVQVKFEYTTPGFYTGAALSLFAMLAALGLWVWYLVRGRPRGSGAAAPSPLPEEDGVLPVEPA